MRTPPPTPTDGLTGLQQAALWRVCLLLCLFATCLVLHAQAGLHTGPVVAYIYTMLAVAYVTSVMLYFWLRSETRVPRALTSLTVLADLAVVTALIAISGGVDSLFAVLFMVVILEGAALAGMTGSLGAATAASFAYICVALLDASGAIEQMDYLRIGAAEPREADLWVFAGLRIFAFYLVAGLGGVLAQRIGRLERHHVRLLENFATGYLATDRAGRLTFLNQAGRRILGCGPQHVAGLPLTDVLRTTPAGSNPVSLSLQLRKEFGEWHCMHARPDGRTVPLNMTTAFIRVGNGHEVQGVMAHFSDETVVQELQETLRQQDRLALAGELSASLAHEVRNPVAAIRGAAQELGTDLPATDVADPTVEQQLLRIIVRESDQLNRVVSHFLEYARVQRQETHPVDLALLLNEVVALLERDMDRLRGITIEREYRTGDGSVAADVGLLKEALLNLVQNAMEAMPEGGTLRLKVQPAPRPGYLDVTIADTGIGISAENQQRVFQPFFTTKSTGTGLGLAIVHRIVEAHEGEIRVQSQPGAGTQMRVRLPRAD